MAGLTLAAGGWINNFIVFLIGEFNVKSIEAAQLWNVVNGCTSMFPVLGAIVADSFLGNFTVICISSLFSLLGIILLLLCSTIDSLRPPPCDQNRPTSCITASRLQLSILYLAITLATIGLGGTRFTIGALGADQFDDPRHQGSFFNWYLFTLYTASAISATAVVYVEDNVSWGWGFGICAAANVVGLAIFVSGSRFYRPVKPKGSPFTGLARVVVAAVQKRNVVVSSKSEDYYNRADNGGVNLVAATPTGAFKFLNRAALLTEGDTKPDGSIAKLWKLCTLQQVEDLKTLIRISPLWSTGILLSTPLAVQMSLATLQAITMNRHIGPHFKIPAGSMLVFIMVSCCIAIIFIERFFFPMWQKVTGRFPPPLQRVGIGHVLCALSMEFPTTLKSTATSMVAMMIALAYYLSTAVVGIVQRKTNWLPDNINEGRMDKVYWVCFGLGGVNFVYYLVCAWLYKYQGAVAKLNPGATGILAERSGLLLLDETEYRVDFLLLLATFGVVAFGISSHLLMELLKLIFFALGTAATAFELLKLVSKLLKQSYKIAKWEFQLLKSVSKSRKMLSNC
ncbi:hypothetical protein RHSIM_RhsimUnG0138600 [Rhododendron simsii]|uniref:Uncharacterized protein n=1 Tax=Rhododendron simsii TaxID=118357 RepID=A0A834FWT6_RHOSS|nr:hypothetical protein RHSIM_RhsimUnG0138600 [Rhododendron simsii]